MLRTAHLVIVGSSNTDLVLSCPRLPRHGETLLGGEFQQFHGGKGANQAVAAARAGANVTFVGARGDDDYGHKTALALKREQINVQHFAIRPGIPSGVALILVGGKSRENCIGVARSANDTLSPEDIGCAASAIRKAGMVVAQLETPLSAVTAAARLAKQHRVPFLLNPAPARRLPKSLLALVDTLTPNEHEAALLTGEADVSKAGLALLRAGCRRVVVTLGARGALWVEADRVCHFPAPKVKAIDTVGAGDCFTGWLATGLAQGVPVETAIGKALLAASVSVTRPGAQASYPFRDEIVL